MKAIELLEKVVEAQYQKVDGYCPWCGAKDYPVCGDKQGYEEVKAGDAEEWRIDHSEDCIVVYLDRAITILKQPKTPHPCNYVNLQEAEQPTAGELRLGDCNIYLMDSSLCMPLGEFKAKIIIMCPNKNTMDKMEEHLKKCDHLDRAEAENQKLREKNEGLLETLRLYGIAKAIPLEL